jgi:DNA polymerase III delta subunit
VWSPRERLFERAIGRVEMLRVERALARLAEVDRLAKGLRVRQADSDPWLELTDLALDIAH